jgi:hypothetical protein
MLLSAGSEYECWFHLKGHSDIAQRFDSLVDIADRFSQLFSRNT